LPQKIDQVATGTASGIQYSHSGSDAAFQELIEKVDVDRAELFLERGHGHGAFLETQAGSATASTSEAPTRRRDIPRS
jgi:hypothetical protein